MRMRVGRLVGRFLIFVFFLIFLWMRVRRSSAMSFNFLIFSLNIFSAGAREGASF